MCERIKTQKQRDVIDRLGKPAEEYFTTSQQFTEQSSDPRFLFPILDYLPWVLISFVYLDHSVGLHSNISDLVLRNCF